MNKRFRLAAGAALCAILGHPRVTTAMLGCHTCCRCDAELGDSAAGFRPFVVVNHWSHLSIGRALELRWRERLMLHPRAQDYLKACRATAGVRVFVEELIFARAGRYGPATRALMAFDYPEAFPPAAAMFARAPARLEPLPVVPPGEE